jgi:hypothetical protein
MSRRGETRKAHRIFIVKHLRKCDLWNRRRWNGNIEKDLKEVDCENGRWKELAQDCVQGWALLVALLTFGFCYHGVVTLRWPVRQNSMGDASLGARYQE